MKSVRDTFEEVAAKGIRDWDLMRTSLNFAEAATSHFTDLIERYVQTVKSSAVPASLQNFYAITSPRMITYGLFVHSTCFGSEHRSKFRQIDKVTFYRTWLEHSVRALSTLKTYSADHSNVPDAIFAELFTLEAEPALNEARLGWWRRIRIHSAIRDRFATGVVLGIDLDMTAAKI